LDIFKLRLTAVIVEPRRNISSDVEREYAAACLTQRCLTGEEMKTKSITSVPNIRIVLVESIVLAGVNVDGSGAR
jgi:hypothetical protein